MIDNFVSSLLTSTALIVLRRKWMEKKTTNHNRVALLWKDNIWSLSTVFENFISKHLSAYLED